MTIREFQRDVQSRTCCYASIGEADKALPAKATIHISEVTVAEEFPAVILFIDGVNMMKLTQIQSIELKGDHYDIICGATDGLRTCVTVHFAIPEFAASPAVYRFSPAS